MRPQGSNDTPPLVLAKAKQGLGSIYDVGRAKLLGCLEGCHSRMKIKLMLISGRKTIFRASPRPGSPDHRYRLRYFYYQHRKVSFRDASGFAYPGVQTISERN